MTLASPNVKIRSGLPDNLEFALILPHVELEMRLPRLRVSRCHGIARTDR